MQGAENYKFFKKLGEGAVGEVYAVAHKQTKEIFAIKRVNKHLAKIREQTDEVINERNILKNLKNSNIIGMRSAWNDTKNYYFLFDYALNGDLSSFLKKNGVIENSIAQFFSA